MIRLTDKKIIDCFFYLLAAAVFCCFLYDLNSGVWFVHSGRLFPWRHLPWFPVYSTTILILEWIGLSAGALLLLHPAHRYFGSVISLLAVAAGLTQRYANHRVLIFLFLLYVVLDKSATRPDGKVSSSAFKMIRYQIFIVYLFSAINKIDSGFLSGHVLANLSEVMNPGLLGTAAQTFFLTGTMGLISSWFAVGLELLIPILLIKLPRIGWICALLLHCGFALLMPRIWSFTLVMMAGSTLFQREKS